MYQVCGWDREGRRLSWEARVEKVGFEVFPERCDRGTVSYLEETLLVHLLWQLRHLLGWVPWLLHLGVFSACCATQYISKQMSLASFGLCSIVPSRTLNLLARIQSTCSTTLLPLEILNFAILSVLVRSLLMCSFTCHGTKAKASLPNKNSALPLPGFQVFGSPKCRS